VLLKLVLNWLKTGLPPFSELVFFESARSRSAVPTANHIHIAVFLFTVWKGEKRCPFKVKLPQPSAELTSKFSQVSLSQFFPFRQIPQNKTF